MTNYTNKNFRIYLLNILVFLLVLGDIFLIKSHYEIFSLFLLFSIVIFTIKLKIESDILILTGIIFLLFPIVAIFTEDFIIAEKMGDWSYFFFFIGISIKFVRSFYWNRENSETYTIENISNDLASLIILIKNIPSFLYELNWEPRFPDTLIIRILKIALKNSYALSIFFLLFLFISKSINEIFFYKNFFIINYWSTYWHKIGLLTTITTISILLIFILVSLRLRKKIKILSLFCLLVLILISTKMRVVARAHFEHEPYIISISPQIASRYMNVKISGRNFNSIFPNTSVFIGDKKQHIVKIDPDEILIEIDPNLKPGNNDLYVESKEKENMKFSNKKEFIYYDSSKSSPEEDKLFWDSLKENWEQSVFGEVNK